MRWLVIVVSLLLACSDEGGAEPVSLGAGRYVELFAWSEAELCAGTLHRLDTFVEAVFLELEEDPPEGPFINYLWSEGTTKPDGEGWDCITGASGCAIPRSQGESVDIRSVWIDHYHELVHAVHLRALGRSAPLLEEGLATYYGDPSDRWAAGADALDDKLVPFFDQGFTPRGRSYPAAKRFVGYTIERYGIEAFKGLWREVPHGISYASFRSVYESRFALSFAEALAEAAEHELIHQTLSRCTGEELDWGEGDDLQVELGGTCDEDDSIGPTLLTPLVLNKKFIVDVPVAGAYQVSIDDLEIPGVALTLMSCERWGEGVYVTVNGGLPVNESLPQGRHVVTIELLADEPSAGVGLSMRLLPP